MKLKVELENAGQKILIVEKKPTPFAANLKEELTKYDNEIFLSPKPPNKLDRFHYCFFINETYPLENLIEKSYREVIFIFVNQRKQAQKYDAFIRQMDMKRVKVVNYKGSVYLNPHNRDAIIWFALSKTKETLLNLQQTLAAKQPEHPAADWSPKPAVAPKFVFDWHRRIKPKSLIIGFIGFFVAYHFLFILPLLGSSYLFYRSANYLKQNQIEKTRFSANEGAILLSLSNSLYHIPRQTFLFFSIAAWPDNLIQINEKTNLSLKETLATHENSRQIFRLLLKKDKTLQEKENMLLRIESLKKAIADLNENSSFLEQKIVTAIPKLKRLREDLNQISDSLGKVSRLLSFSDYFLAKDGEKKFLLLFANNMELRPGGGFIGSFGILTMKDLTLEEIKIYDVYDADGQLIAHVEPPAPLKKYLEQPHWFLRDSAFSGDFSENYEQAVFFLGKELNLNGFSGGILITTSAIQNILGAFDKIYLPDFNESVTPENFYIKAQLYAEKNFFPGSTQKKSFLSSLTRQLMINLENVAPSQLVKGIKKSLDEKQIVIYFDSPDIQKTVNSFYWSGRIIDPHCPPNLTNCYADSIFPLDANLGVNKTNFFVNKTMDMKINIDKDGFIRNNLTIKFKNDSPNNVFPGGTYKNYFQILLPADSVVDKITKNDIAVDNIDENIDRFRQVGFLMEVKPKETAEINIGYHSSMNLKKGRAYYQLVTQKQIGSSNADLTLNINLPNNIYINQNFTPLVKEKQIIYNTGIAADKIFFIELLKEN